ncbi:MAG: DUF4124 domain-containing protein [Leucothrix sp.]
MKKPTLFILLSLLISIPVESALYRWVDDNGKVHYGDKVPPKVAQNGHTKLNKNGTVKEKVDSADARKQKLLSLRQERIRQKALKEAKRKEDLQEMHDTQLMSMFSNIEELKNVYHSKMEMADESIKVLKARHKRLSNKLELFEARHERMLSPADKRKLGMKIEDMLDNLHIYQQAITENLIERDDLEERFDKDLARYKKITRKTASEG